MADVLPLEVLANIFRYIDDIKDLKAITLVSKHWLKGTQVTKITNNLKLRLKFVTKSSSNRKAISFFADKEPFFLNIYFKSASYVSIDGEFWERWSEHITEIIVDYKSHDPDLPSENFVQLLKYTPRLKRLNLICSLEAFNKFVNELSVDDRQTIFRNIRNVQELHMGFREPHDEVLGFEECFCFMIDETTPWSRIDQVNRSYFRLGSCAGQHNLGHCHHLPNLYNDIGFILCVCFDNLRQLNLDGDMTDDSSLVYIFQLKNLRVLKMRNAVITDYGFTDNYSTEPKRTIANLEELEVLNIDFCKELRSAAFYALKLKKLKHLSAKGTSLNGRHMSHIADHCPRLESLNLSNCQKLGESDIQAISEHLIGLKTLEIESCQNINRACFEQIMKYSKTLQTLNVSECSTNVKLIAKEMFVRVKSLRRIISCKDCLYRCDFVS